MSQINHFCSLKFPALTGSFPAPSLSFSSWCHALSQLTIILFIAALCFPWHLLFIWTVSVPADCLLTPKSWLSFLFAFLLTWLKSIGGAALCLDFILVTLGESLQECDRGIYQHVNIYPRVCTPERGLLGRSLIKNPGVKSEVSANKLGAVKKSEITVQDYNTDAPSVHSAGPHNRNLLPYWKIPFWLQQ